VKEKEGEKRRGWREKDWGSSVVLAYAIRYRHRDALARVHGPIFALARIIPRREPLHKIFRIRARTEVRVYEHIYHKNDEGETHDHDIK
jgi:hypothetical protein